MLINDKDSKDQEGGDKTSEIVLELKNRAHLLSEEN